MLGGGRECSGHWLPSGVGGRLSSARPLQDGAEVEKLLLEEAGLGWGPSDGAGPLLLA